MSRLDHEPTDRPSKGLLACGAAALLVLNAGLLAIRPQTGQAGVVVSPERFRIPLGTSRLTTTIEIRNRTLGLIEIISVWPSCDCIVCDVPAGELQSGAVAKVGVTMRMSAPDSAVDQVVYVKWKRTGVAGAVVVPVRFFRLAGSE